MSNIPTTITEAQRAGWESLEASCGKCRGTVHMPWRLLRTRSKSEELAYIMQRATCQQCGNGTRPTSFALVRMKPGGSGAPTIERLQI